MAVRRPRSTAPSTTFSQLGVPAPLVEALAKGGVTTPFPIQAATLPDVLAGRDVLGRGRTGSGKTYAFAVPLLARLAARHAPPRAGRPRALILAPTRELAAQIEASIAPLAAAVSLRTLAVFGGVPRAVRSPRSVPGWTCSSPVLAGFWTISRAVTPVSTRSR
ncbi:hypothetical protein Psuf_005550 [Phytohabitans suffuscus]|uniref:Helicase ATP-binding domain-containing protein n=1 Tax=Phytohabitans suffuscus TaxID=624315 RepID=A0A6F8YAU8_9ACTN|nr:hypothetical protein Psuf_005550 [Phytohabitans suffuscus]